MDTELKAKWVAALRSGEYEQGTGGLITGTKYCCLGVLCVVAKIQMLYSELEKLNMGESTITQLVTQNDQMRNTFPQIADYIEAHL